MPNLRFPHKFSVGWTGHQFSALKRAAEDHGWSLATEVRVRCFPQSAAKIEAAGRASREKAQEAAQEPVACVQPPAPRLESPEHVSVQPGAAQSVQGPF